MNQGHNPTRDKRETAQGMRGKATRMEGQAALDETRSAKDPGTLTVGGDDIGIVTAVAE